MEFALQCISFLDVCIKVNNDNTDTWRWRKPTHTALLLNFNANCPKKWKFKLILCLLYRAKLICSINFLFFNEVGVLKNMFLSNGYTLWSFEECFKKFNKKCLHSDSACCDHVYNLNIPYFAKAPDDLSINYKTLSTPNFN